MTHDEATVTTAERYRWECPECKYDWNESNSLATEREVYCGLCAEDCGRNVVIRKWLPEEEQAITTHDEATIERVKRAIYAVASGVPEGEPHNWEICSPLNLFDGPEAEEWYEDMARAALDALGPGLEEVLQSIWDDRNMNVGELHPNMDGGWTAEVVSSGYDVAGWGTGKTPRDAIRAAVDAAREASRDMTAQGEGT